VEWHYRGFELASEHQQFAGLREQEDAGQFRDLVGQQLVEHQHVCLLHDLRVAQALSFLTQNLAQEFAPKVRVNAIAVGSIRTEALAGVLTPEIERQMVELTPLGRLGEVEDIAACALYLASPAASYVTGEIYGVNGGLVALNMKMPRAFD